MSTSEILSLLQDQSAAWTKFKSANDTRHDANERRMLDIEKKLGRAGPGGPAMFATKSLGDRVTEAFGADERKSLASAGRVKIEVPFGPSDIERKDSPPPTLTTTDVGSVRSLGGMAPSTAIGLQSALATEFASSVTALEYSRYTGIASGAAAVQATEGSAKARVQPGMSLIRQSAITVAAYSKVSTQALDDASELRTLINGVLAREIAIAWDTVLSQGSGQLFTGYEDLADESTSLVYERLADAISEAVSVMVAAGFNPSVVVLSPADWLAVQVLQSETEGLYLSGSYLGALPQALRGMRVVQSPSLTTGKALVIDPAFNQQIVTSQLSITVGTTGTDFTDNLRVILAEMRVVPTYRAVGSAVLVAAKAVGGGT